MNNDQKSIPTDPKFSLRNFSIVLLILTGLLYISFAIYSLKEHDQNTIIREQAFRTWRLEKLYRNGEVIKDGPYMDMRLKVNKDNTAEWIRAENNLKIAFKIAEDASQILIDDMYTFENIEKIFELNENRFRFGKKNIRTHYEYVMVPADE